jgi:hypothetical protein
MPYINRLKRAVLPGLTIAVLYLVVAACSSPAQTTDTPSSPEEAQVTSGPGASLETLDAMVDTPLSSESITLPGQPAPAGLDRPASALPVASGELFAASGVCTTCHTSLVDEAGVDVSTDSMWRSTMMANSSRDPYWRASVRAEVSVHPIAEQAIREKCATCHMPMVWFTATHKGEPVAVLGEDFFPEEHELHPFAMDGVSCTLCHQIEDQNLGTPDSFSGGFVVDTNAPFGERKAYGPYNIPRGQAIVMISASGYIPIYAEHIQKSEICAICHNLTTDTLEASGAVVGQFHEQMVFLEWQHSDYVQTHACQDCHMPVANGGVSLSITGGPKRQPFYQHHFVGGNVYMSQILDYFAGDLGVTASSEQFQMTQQRTLDQLQNRTMTLQFESLRIENGELVADLILSNQVGHKLPSGFPSRRAWVHFTVLDAAGGVMFDSGRANPDGSIQGNVNDADPSQFEPHYQVINMSDQVQIYEVIFVDVEGQVTTGLLTGYEYVKDNRFLPVGFDKLAASPEIAVYGEALTDEDFSGGIDRLSYQVALGQAQGPFTVTAHVLYQTVGFRWMENLRAFQGTETDQMARYYDTIANTPILLAGTSQQMGE